MANEPGELLANATQAAQYKIEDLCHAILGGASDEDLRRMAEATNQHLLPGLRVAIANYRAALAGPTKPVEPRVPLAQSTAVPHTPPPYYWVHGDFGVIFVCRRWDQTVRPGDASTFGSDFGAHIAEIHYNGGVPTREQAEANAEFVVRACNSFASLLAGCERVLHRIPILPHLADILLEVDDLRLIRAAVAEAGGKGSAPITREEEAEETARRG